MAPLANEFLFDAEIKEVARGGEKKEGDAMKNSRLSLSPPG